jgi:hypothetical protein
MTYDVGNPSHGLGQAQKCGWPCFEPVTGIPTLLMFFVIICLCFASSYKFNLYPGFPIESSRFRIDL